MEREFTTITVGKNTWAKLSLIKLENKAKTINDVIEHLLTKAKEELNGEVKSSPDVLNEKGDVE